MCFSSFAISPLIVASWSSSISFHPPLICFSHQSAIMSFSPLISSRLSNKALASLPAYRYLSQSTLSFVKTFPSFPPSLLYVSSRSFLLNNRSIYQPYFPTLLSYRAYDGQLKPQTSPPPPPFHASVFPSLSLIHLLGGSHHENALAANTGHPWADVMPFKRETVMERVLKLEN